jgi:hypothetical protein
MSINSNQLNRFICQPTITATPATTSNKFIPTEANKVKS